MNLCLALKKKINYVSYIKETTAQMVATFLICIIFLRGFINKSMTSSLHKQASHVSSVTHKSCNKSYACFDGEYSLAVLKEAVSNII